VRPGRNNGQNESSARGYVSGVSIAGINVPHALRPLLANQSVQEKFTVSVSFGQRFEPWIASLEVANR